MLIQDDSLCLDTVNVVLGQPDSLTLGVDDVQNVTAKVQRATYVGANGGAGGYSYAINNGQYGPIALFDSLLQDSIR